MPYPNSQRQNDVADHVTPKEREMLLKRREKFLAEMNDRLARLPEDCLDRPELERKRDHCFSKFPNMPVNMSVWTIAYYEDWIKEYDRARGVLLHSAD